MTLLNGLILVVLFFSFPIILPWLLLGTAPDRLSRKYQFGWWGMVVLTAAICLATWLYVMWMPYYSQTLRRSNDLLALAGSDIVGGAFILLCYAAVIVPSFIGTFLLGYRTRQRE